MSDAECVVFLQWALPRMGMRWAGFRKVRRQVCRRVERRRRELGLADLAAYRARLEEDPGEWEALEGLARVTISRFYRDRGVWEFLGAEVLPALAGSNGLRAWSAGCGSGEEPYTLALVWDSLEILATDVDARLLARAREACYPASSLKELPERLRAKAFDEGRCLRPERRRAVTFLQHDVRDSPPPGPFHLVLCRNLVFTYHDAACQREACRRFAAVMQPGAALVLGAHETLPDGAEAFEAWSETHRVYRRA
jgi:chemotaxis protein methyltransferase CheR